MRVERRMSTKRDAERVWGWMRRCGFTYVQLIGSHGNWVVFGYATDRCLTKFACIEVGYESKKK